MIFAENLDGNKKERKKESPEQTKKKNYRQKNEKVRT